jgi:hypothetical protein
MNCHGFSSGVTLVLLHRFPVDDPIPGRDGLAMHRDEVDLAENPELRELAQRRVAKLKETVAQAETPKKKPKHDW